MNPIKDVFIGSAKVLTNVLENNIVSYTLDNGLNSTATLDQFKAMCSEMPYDDGKISLNKWRPVIEQIIQLLKDNNAQLQDIGWVLDRVNESINQNHKRALNKLYGVDDVSHVTLQLIDDILRADASL